MKLDTKSKVLKLKFLSCCLEPPAWGRQYLPQPSQEPSGRGEKGMQPFVPTSQGSAGDEQQQFTKQTHTTSPLNLPPCNFPDLAPGHTSGPTGRVKLVSLFPDISALKSVKGQLLSYPHFCQKVQAMPLPLITVILY